jgi:hypothetical protein
MGKQKFWIQFAYNYWQLCPLLYFDENKISKLQNNYECYIIYLKFYFGPLKPPPIKAEVNRK